MLRQKAALALVLGWSALALAPGLAAAQTRAAPEAASGFEAKPTVSAASHMIVAAHPLAADAGLKVLRAGGSAVDAAIAAQLVLAVVEPQSSGLGGGAFALVLTPNGTREAWDGRETAPAAATPTMFLDPDGAPQPFLDAARSGRSIGAPGLAALMAELHAAHGRLPWRQLFADAIAHADEGFRATPRLAAALARHAPALRADHRAAATFFRRDGAPKSAGDWIFQPRLAITLRRLRDLGSDAVYKSALTAEIAAASRRHPRPGALAAADIAAYRPVKRAPVCAAYKDAEICGMGPPSSGAHTVAQILGIFERAGGAAPWPSALARSRFAAAARLAYADRNHYLADPAYLDAPLDGLLDDRYLTARAALIGARPSPAPARPGAPPGLEASRFAPADETFAPGTTHLTVIDAEGGVVSLTSSIEIAFGSARTAGGFFLNNQLTDFSFRPEKDGRPVANAAAPGKRPRSSMAPTLIFKDGAFFAALGSPGGSRIIEYVAGATLSLLDAGLAPGDAAAAPHVSRRNRAPTIVEDRPEANRLAEALAALGHDVRRAPMTSGLAIIVKTDAGLLGGADPRREGVALGD